MGGGGGVRRRHAASTHCLEVGAGLQGVLEAHAVLLLLPLLLPLLLGSSGRGAVGHVERREERLRQLLLLRWLLLLLLRLLLACTDNRTRVVVEICQHRWHRTTGWAQTEPGFNGLKAPGAHGRSPSSAESEAERSANSDES